MIRYKFIDDEDVSSHIKLLTGPGILEINWEKPPQSLDEFILTLRNLQEDTIDGIIFDWQIRMNYGSAALAQELADINRYPEQSGRVIPLIVCTGQSYINSIHKSNNYSTLFNYIYKKEDITKNYQQIQNELLALACGYKKLNNNNGDILPLIKNPEGENFNEIESHLNSLNAIHDKAIFFTKEVLFKPGILIDEALLSVRLGVDREKSVDSWVKLKNDYLADYQYNGIFNKGWNRWWSYSIENWFKNKTGEVLSNLPVDVRVDRLIDLTKIYGLKPLSENEGSKFLWAISRVSQKPIEPLEGFTVLSPNLYNWQDREYISYEEGLKNTYGDEDLQLVPNEEILVKRLRDEKDRL